MTTPNRWGRMGEGRFRRSTYISLKTGKAGWVYDFIDDTGRRRQVAGDTKAAAKAKADAKAGVVGREITVEDAWDLHRAALVRGGSAPGTVQNHDGHFTNHISPRLGRLRITRLMPTDVQEFLDSLRDAGCTDYLVRRVKDTLAAIFDEAIRLGHCRTNPVRAIRARRRSRRAIMADTTGIIIPSREDVRHLILGDVPSLMAPRRPSRQALLILLVVTGLRIGEARGLRWIDVTVDGTGSGYIRVRQAADGGNRLGPVKTAASRRDVPFGPAVADALARWAPECPRSDLGLVFPTGRGGVESYSNLDGRWWRPLQEAVGVVDEAGAPKYTIHTLRHFAISLWIAAGVKPKQVQAWAGHESFGFTMSRYAHLFDDSERDRQAVAGVEEAIRLLSPPSAAEGLQDFCKKLPVSSDKNEENSGS